MSTTTELMKIEVAKAIARAFDNSGGVVRSDNLHALVDAYEAALSRLAAAEPRAVENAIKERDEAIRSAAEADKAIVSLRERATSAEAEAKRLASETEAAAKERDDALRRSRDAAATVAGLRAALRLKMEEYRPHDPGFCQACDAARVVLNKS